MKIEGKAIYKKGVYIITCLANGDRYIGSSRNLKSRFSDHKCLLNNGTSHNRHMQSAWNKYGGESFEFLILEYVMFDNFLIEREQYWINYLCPEFNKTKKADSGFLGRQHSQETKNRLSAIQRERMTSLERREKLRIKATEQNKRQPNGMKGKTLSNERKEALRQYTIKQFSSTESRRKHGQITKAGMKKSGASEKIRVSKLGLKATNETKNKMSNVHKIRWAKMSPEKKQKIARKIGDAKAKDYKGFVSPDGIIYRDVNNLSKFCRKHNLSISKMCLVAQGKRNHHQKWMLIGA